MSENCGGGTFCLIFPTRQWIVYKLSTAFTQHSSSQPSFTITGMNNAFYRHDGDITIMIWTQTAAVLVLTRPVKDYFRISSIYYNL
jgi:hypothetical protein